MPGIPGGPGGTRTVDPRLGHFRHPVAQALQALSTVVLGRLSDDAATRNLDASHQGIEDESRLADVKGLLVARRHPARMENHLGPLSGDLLDEGAKFGGGYVGVSFLPFRGGFLDRLPQDIHAGDELVDKFLVPGALFQDLVDEGEVEGVVAVGPQLPVAVGLAGGEAGPRIDIGHAHPVREGRHERFGLLHHQRLDDVAAVEDEVLGVPVVEDESGRRETVGRTARVVGVASATGVVIEVIRGAERLHKGLGQVGKRAATIGERDAPSAEGLDRLLQLVGDIVEGLVPGRALPLAAAARAGPDERGLGSLIVGLEGESCRALRAKAGADGLVVRVSLQPGGPAVLDRHFNRAAHRAHAAQAVDQAFARSAHTARIGGQGGIH